jgi:4-hydroxy 2-oxovalerate aldolase
MTVPMNILDCTFRDGGYYNDWDFKPDAISSYLSAMKGARVDIVELGFRFITNKGFKGPAAYATDDWIRSLGLSDDVAVSVMVNASDLLTEIGLEASLEQLFPEPASSSPVSIVRIACHYAEFQRVLPATQWLNDRGFRVGFNLMQMSDRSEEEVQQFCELSGRYPVEVLYFADSTGSMTPDDVSRVIRWMRSSWRGPIGVHTHDNMGLALQNTMRAYADGATWLDATVTGMGRGPGNARTEELVIAAEAHRQERANIVPLMELIRKHFGPLKNKYGWGSNPYYFLSGMYGIHPTYIQEMLGDARYKEEDILAVIEHLRDVGGKKFSAERLTGARSFYSSEPKGTWSPVQLMKDREVLILATGPGVAAHRDAIEAYIRRKAPLVLALNTQSAIDSGLIDLRIACHPVRLLADTEAHKTLNQPLIVPASMLPDGIRQALGQKQLLDFGLSVKPEQFAFEQTFCILPSPLVLAYSLAVATSGQASRILMAGFDGYAPGDPRNDESSSIIAAYRLYSDKELISVTPTKHPLKTVSIYSSVI